MKVNLKAISKQQYLIPLKVIAVYLVWRVFHHYALKEGSPVFLFWNQVAYYVGTIFAAISTFFLKFFVDSAHSDGISICFNSGTNYRVVLVQEHCLAIPAMVIFTATVLFFPGSWKKKAWFWPIGLFGIVMINVVRIVLVCLAWMHLTPYFFNLHHSVIYVVLTYGFIFLMMRWWMDYIIADQPA